MTTSKKHQRNEDEDKWRMDIEEVGTPLITGWKFDLGGSDQATTRMEEINPNVDTGCLPYLAAINPHQLSAPFNKSSRVRVVAHWYLPLLVLLGLTQQGQCEAPPPL